MTRRILVVLLLMCTIASNAQDEYISDLLKNARDHFAEGEYKIALKEYERLFKSDSSVNEYTYCLGVCLVETARKNERAVELIERVIDDNELESERFYYLGRAYMSVYEFTKAVEMFFEYKSLEKTKEFYLKESERYVQMAYNAKELMSQPLNVSFENLGDQVNSSLDDFSPFVPENESYMVFASNKKFDNVYGTFVTNLYIANPTKKGWAFAQSDRNVNSFDNEEPVFITSDGKKLFVCNNLEGQFGDILIADKKSRDFRISEKEEEMLKRITSGSHENGACVTADWECIYFSSDRKGGKGGFDIYMVKKLPNGTWAEPENMEAINTPYDDAFPNISTDGEVLYFASKGHNSIGGYDIFVSYWNKVSQSWTKPLNLGYPINTTDDNKTISFPKNKRYAYLSTIRKEGYGGYDIYRVTFNDMDVERTLIKGEIRLGAPESSGSFKGESSELIIEIYDIHGNLFGMYLPKPGTGNFVAILPPGKYTIKVEFDGYNSYEEVISIGDRNLFKDEMEKKVYLLPIN